MVYDMQEPVENGAMQQEASSLNNIKQEAPSSDVIAAGAAISNKVVDLEHAAMSAAHPMTSASVLQEH